MPVYRFKTFEEADRALWNFSPDENYFKNVKALYDLTYRLSEFKCPPGIFKFKTFEEASRHRMEVETGHGLKLREKRRKKSAQ